MKFSVNKIVSSVSSMNLSRKASQSESSATRAPARGWGALYKFGRAEPWLGPVAGGAPPWARTRAEICAHPCFNSVPGEFVPWEGGAPGARIVSRDTPERTAT